MKGLKSQTDSHLRVAFFMASGDTCKDQTVFTAATTQNSRTPETETKRGGAKPASVDGASAHSPSRTTNMQDMRTLSQKLHRLERSAEEHKIKERLRNVGIDTLLTFLNSYGASKANTREDHRFVVQLKKMHFFGAAQVVAGIQMVLDELNISDFKWIIDVEGTAEDLTLTLGLEDR